MNTRFTQVRRYAFLIVGALTFSFLVVFGVLIFYFFEFETLKVRTADFHLATIQSAFQAKEVLFEVREQVAALPPGHRPRSDASDAADPALRRAILRNRSRVYAIAPILSSITDLQSEFGGDRFEATVMRAKFYGDALTENLAGPSPAIDTDIQAFQTTVIALELSLSQLARLHSIAQDAAAELYERNTRLANSILLPGALVIVLGGIFALRHFIRQIGASLEFQAQAEADLNRLNRELESKVEERTAQLRSAEEELIRKERLAAIGQVTATVSHELRNPLGAIRSGIDAVKTLSSGGNGQLQRAINVVDRSMNRCENIITELLNFTRVQTLKWEATDVDDWLTEVLDECDLAPSIILQRELGAATKCPFDRERLRRAVLNVIENSSQAMENGPPDQERIGERRLTATSRQVDGRLEITIDDTGPGISADDISQIFEPLYSTKAIGVGLGLPTVKQILEQHGGGVDLNSRPGRGTKVVLWFPMHSTEHEALSCVG